MGPRDAALRSGQRAEKLWREMETKNMGIRGSQGKGSGKGRRTGLLCRTGEGKNTSGWGGLRVSRETTLKIDRYLLWH